MVRALPSWRRLHGEEGAIRTCDVVARSCGAS